MARILINGLRFIEATKNIKINTKKYCHVPNCFHNNTVEISIKQDQLFNCGCIRLQLIQAQMNSVKYCNNCNNCRYSIPSFNADATLDKMVFEEQKKNTKKQEISSKLSNLILIPGSGKMTVKIQKNDKSYIDQFIFNNTANIKVKGNMPITSIHNAANEKDRILESKNVKFNVSFDNGKLILKSRSGGTYTISQTIFIKADNKFNKNLKNEYAAEENAPIKTQTLDIGKFNMSLDKAKCIRGDRVIIMDGKDGIDDNTVIKELDENLKKAIGCANKTFKTQYCPANSFLYKSSLNLSYHSTKTTLKTLEGDESLSVHQITDVRIEMPFTKHILQVVKSNLELTSTPQFDRCVVQVDSGNLILKNQRGDAFHINKLINIAFNETEDGPIVDFL